LHARLTVIAVVAAAIALASAAPAAAAPFPENSAAPQIQGPTPPQDGLTYTVKQGSWTGPPGQSLQFSHQWLRCNAAGAGCQTIAGAGDSSYTLTAADAGARVRVRETAACMVTTPVCAPASSDSAPTAPVLSDPFSEAAPEVSGTAQVGQVLNASVGFWRSPVQLLFGYQWIRCDAAGGACAQIPGATGPNFRIKTAQAGARLRAVVSASNSRPRSAQATSAPTLTVAAAVKKKARRKRAARLLSPFPRIVIAGVVIGGVVELSEFTIRGPRGAIVKLRCRGRGCPLRTRRLRTRATRVRFHSLERAWRAGTVLDVTIGRRGFIGKFSRFSFRAGAVPRRQDRCLRPGATRPSRCPRR
jgi:hypothetical protein